MTVVPARGFVNVNMRLQSVDYANDGPTTGFPELVNPTVQLEYHDPHGGGPLANWTLTGSVTPAASFVDLANVVDLQIQNTLQACSSLCPRSARLARARTTRLLPRS